MPDSFGLSDIGCVRANNEDSLLDDPSLGLYAIADGMGGARAGEVASRMAIDCLREAIAMATTRDADTLVQAFESVHRRIRLAAAGNPDLHGMGTTLVCALESGQSLIIATAGDSRAWLHAGGALTLITRDQTWVNEVGRQLGIPDERLKVHPLRNVLTVALGASPSIRVQIHHLEPAPGSLVLLSSDGLHGTLPAPEIEKILSTPITLAERAHLLIEAAKAAGGPDNISVVLLQY